jgi:excisionase family DNA binding protein
MPPPTRRAAKLASLASLLRCAAPLAILRCRLLEALPCPHPGQPSARSPRRRYISINDAAEYLGVTERTIRQMISDGRLIGYRNGAKFIRQPTVVLRLERVRTASRPVAVSTSHRFRDTGIERSPPGATARGSRMRRQQRNSRLGRPHDGHLILLGSKAKAEAEFRHDLRVVARRVSGVVRVGVATQLSCISRATVYRVLAEEADD